MTAADPFRHAFGCFEDLDRRMAKAQSGIREAWKALERGDLDSMRSWLGDADGHLEAARREARETSQAVVAARDRAEIPTDSDDVA
jgi:hypothetical protein